MDNKDTGLLLDRQNILLQRQYFQEMLRLHGIRVIYRAPRENKHFDGYGELDSFYYDPIVTSCIFDEHPTQWTMKKLGWNAELSDSPSIISVPYDLEKLQVGSLFIIPSAIDHAQGRLFKVIRMSTIAVYPASVTCEIGPVFENKEEKSQIVDFSKTNFNVLKEEEED